MGKQAIIPDGEKWKTMLNMANQEDRSEVCKTVPLRKLKEGHLWMEHTRYQCAQTMQACSRALYGCEAPRGLQTLTAVGQTAPAAPGCLQPAPYIP